MYQEFYKKGRVNRFCEYAFRLFNKDRSGYLGRIKTNNEFVSIRLIFFSKISSNFFELLV